MTSSPVKVGTAVALSVHHVFIARGRWLEQGSWPCRNGPHTTNGGSMPNDDAIRTRAAQRRQLHELRADQERQLQELRAELAAAHGAESARRPGWKTAALGAFLLAAISVGGALTGTYVGAKTTIDTNRQQVEEVRAKESREKRAQIYADYLGAARDYIRQANRTRVVLRRSQKADLYFRSHQADPAARSRAMQGVSQIGVEGQTTKTMQKAYDKQIVLVFVYGSDAAWQALLAVGRTAADPALAVEDLSSADPSTLTESPLATEAQGNALRRFEAIFCQEASATPRKGCGE
jgi:hypothetical protein